MTLPRPRLRRFSAAPHNPDILGTTPARVGAYYRRSFTLDQAMGTARMCGGDRALLGFLLEYLCGPYGDHFQRAGVSTTYREYAQVVRCSLPVAARRWRRCLERRWIARRAEPDTWRGPQGYRYHVVHPRHWRTANGLPVQLDDPLAEMLPTIGDEEGGGPWLDLDGAPVGVIALPVKHRPTLTHFPAELVRGPGAEFRNANDGPVDNSEIHVPPTENIRGRVSAGSEYKVLSTSLLGDHVVDGYWLRRWVGNGRIERRDLVSEVRRHLDRCHSGWENLPPEPRQIPRSLVVDVVERLEKIDVDSEARWGPGVVRQAIARAIVRNAELQLDELAITDRQQQRQAELQAVEVGQTVRIGRSLLKRAQRVQELARSHPGAIASRELSGVLEGARELQQAIERLEADQVDELAIAIALCDRLVDVDGLDILELELGELAAAELAGEDLVALGDLVDHLEQLADELARAAQRAAMTPRPDVEGAGHWRDRFAILQPWRELRGHGEKCVNLRHRLLDLVDQVRTCDAGELEHWLQLGRQLLQSGAELLRDSPQLHAGAGADVKTGPDREASDLVAGENGGSLVAFPADPAERERRRRRPKSQDLVEGVIPPAASVSNVAPDGVGRLPTADAGDLALAGAVFGGDRREAGPQAVPADPVLVDADSASCALHDHADSLPSEPSAERVPPTDADEQRARSSRRDLLEPGVDRASRTGLEISTHPDWHKLAGAGLIGLALTHKHVETLVDEREVLDVEGRELATTKAAGDAEKNHGPIADPGGVVGQSGDNASDLGELERSSCSGIGPVASGDAAEDRGDLGRLGRIGLPNSAMERGDRGQMPPERRDTAVTSPIGEIERHRPRIGGEWAVRPTGAPLPPDAPGRTVGAPGVGTDAELSQGVDLFGELVDDRGRFEGDGKAGLQADLADGDPLAEEATRRPTGAILSTDGADHGSSDLAELELDVDDDEGGSV